MAEQPLLLYGEIYKILALIALSTIDVFSFVIIYSVEF